MQIGFITDTNILNKSKEELNKDRKFLNNANFFIEYIESLENTSSQDKLIYFMPNIILEELYYQKLYMFNESYKRFCEKYNDISYGLNGALPESNIESILDNEKKEYENKIKILQLPYTKKIFIELTEDALKKNPPFDKSQEGKKTDAGYKDALIWKTIIYSKEINECEKVYFFSGDKIFIENEKYLKDEFIIHHPNTELKIVFIEPDGNQRQNCLKKIIEENKLIETEIIKLYDLNLILDYLKTVKYKYNEDVYYYSNNEKTVLENIMFDEFIKEDFQIENVKKIEEKYEVIVLFNTKKYKVNINNDDYFNKKILYGKVKFIFLKNKSEFSLEEYQFIKIEFQSTISEIYSNISKIVIDLYNEEFAEVIQNFVQNIGETLNNINNEFITTNIINNIKKNLPSFDKLGNTSTKLKLEENIKNE